MINVVRLIFVIIAFFCVIAIPVSAGSSLPLEFSPDGLLLAAARPAKPSGVKLVLFNVEEQIAVRTLAIAESISEVRYSPDGQHLCISARNVAGAKMQRTADPHDGDDLYMVELDGSPPLRITYQGAAYPSYSPSGEFVAYVGPNNEIASIDIEGCNWCILTRNPPTKSIRDWLKDDKSFFSTEVSNGYIARYAFTPPSKHLVRISPIHASGGNMISPQLSPDGKALAYLMANSVDAQNDILRIFIQEKDVSREIASLEGNGLVNNKPGLTWSSEGSKIAISAGFPWLVDCKTGVCVKLRNVDENVLSEVKIDR